MLLLLVLASLCWLACDDEADAFKHSTAAMEISVERAAVAVEAAVARGGLIRLDTGKGRLALSFFGFSREPDATEAEDDDFLSKWPDTVPWVEQAALGQMRQKGR